MTEVCPDKRAWQVGIASVQVPNQTEEEVKAKAQELHNCSNCLQAILAEVSVSAGYQIGSATYNQIVNSTGVLQKSLLLRDPATGVYFVEKEVFNECIQKWLSWCNGGWDPAKFVATNQQVVKDFIEQLKSYFLNVVGSP